MRRLAKLTMLLLLLTTMLLQSCDGVQNVVSNLTVEGGAIPPDLGADESTLVVQLYGKNWHDKYLKRHFKANYLGKYELVTEEELASDSYGDSTLYRYVFFSHVQRTHYDRQTHYAHTYGLKDRATSMNYAGGFTSTFGPYIKAYTINLEKVRAKNSAKR